MLPLEVKEIFLQNTIKTPDSCWTWKGKTKNGLPFIRIKEEWYSPRRVSLELVGLALTDKHVHVTCQNKLCVNPEHLVTGDEARFWSKVSKGNTCWLWTDGSDKDNYGKFMTKENGIQIDHRAHIYSYELKHDPIPEGMCVCHTCDNPPCVNPFHLFLGTTEQNTFDRNQKGRQAKGAKVATSKLEDEDVKTLRLLSDTLSVTQLAKRFNITRSSVYAILARRTWKHV